MSAMHNDIAYGRKQFHNKHAGLGGPSRNFCLEEAMDLLLVPPESPVRFALLGRPWLWIGLAMAQFTATDKQQV